MAEIKKRVLFIDDMECNRTLVNMLLRKNGYDVTTLSYLDEVQDEARTDKFAAYDAVISDLDLGDGRDGVEVAKLVRDVAPQLPVFLWSGSAEMLDTDQRSLFDKILTTKGGAGVSAEMDGALREFFGQSSGVAVGAAPVLPQGMRANAGALAGFVP